MLPWLGGIINVSILPKPKNARHNLTWIRIFICGLWLCRKAGRQGKADRGGWGCLGNGCFHLATDPHCRHAPD